MKRAGQVKEAEELLVQLLKKGYDIGKASQPGAEPCTCGKATYTQC